MATDRLPLDPPFSVGAKVRYVGPRKAYADREGRIPLMALGTEFRIDRVQRGRDRHPTLDKLCWEAA